MLGRTHLQARHCRYGRPLQGTASCLSGGCGMRHFVFCVKNEIFLTVFSARSAATAAKLPSVRQRRLERQQAGQKNQQEISSFFPAKSEFHIRPEPERTGAKTAPPEARPTQNGSSPDAGCGLRGLYGFIFGGYIFLKRQLEITRF